MEIAPGIHLIRSTVGRRPLQLYLLVGEQRTLLLDSGGAAEPEKAIFPYMAGLGRAPADLDMVLITHPDQDHCGGNGAIRRAHPRVLISCGSADRALVEDPQVMWARRYNAYEQPHGLAYDESGRAAAMAMLGEATAVDFTWSGGESLRLGRDWVVEIHHVPGHSPGHLAAFDPRSRTVLTGDAVHGAVYLDVDGQPALPPTYLHVDSYLATIRYLRALNAEALAGCHWPVKRGQEVAAFLDESQQFVETADLALLAELRRRPEGATVRELIPALGPQLGGWPRNIDSELVYALAGNLEHLVAQGRLHADTSRRPIRYQL